MDYSMTPAQAEQPALVTGVSYAGFWRRFVAYILDALICGAVFWPMSFLFGFPFFRAYSGNSEQAVAMMSGVLLFSLFEIVAVWLYFSLMESGKNQGTLGKMALGLRVTDLDGNRLTFGRATGRYFAKMLSGLTLMVGFIMAGFTQKKQALHDMVASTLVLRKQAMVPAQVATNAFSAN